MALKNQFSIIIFNLLLITSLLGQVGINEMSLSPDPSAMLDVKSLNKGLLYPRMTMTQRDNIVNPAHSLMVYQTDGIEGYYYNHGSPGVPQWIRIETNLSSLDHIGRIPIDSLPFVIVNPGSYYLTKNLSAITGIDIQTSNVSIDLNGHSISGSSGNSSSAIKTSTPQNNISVYNGMIQMWANEGIAFSNTGTSQLYNLIVSSNGLDGIWCGKNTQVNNVIARGNGADGIDVGESSTVSNVISESNINDGIEADHGAVIFLCSASGNGAVGIKTTNISTVSECSSYLNSSHGFQIGSGSTVSTNSSSNNVGSGFHISSSCIISNNTVRVNTKYGFEIVGNDNVFRNNGAHSNSMSGFYTLFDRNLFESNTSTFNAMHGFDIQGSGCLIVKNTASGNITSAFNVIGGNIMATSVTGANINTNTNPNANISY